MASFPPKRGVIWAWVFALALVAGGIFVWRSRPPAEDPAPPAPSDPAPLSLSPPAQEDAGTDPGPDRPHLAGGTADPAARDGGTTPVATHAMGAADGGTRWSGTKPASAKGPRTGWATVDGRSELDGTPPENAKIDHGADPRCVMAPGARDEAVKVQDGRLENVALEAIPKDLKPPPKGWRAALSDPSTPKPVTLVESGCELVPRMQAVTVGARVEIINHDYTRHQIRLVRDGQQLAQAELQPREKVRDLAADGPGVVEVQCARHPWEHAYVVIAPAGSRVAVTHSSGRLHLDQLAPGHWTFKAWHERFGWQTHELDLAPGDTAQLPVTYTAPSAPPVQTATDLPH